MSGMDAFEVIETGDGQWDVQVRDGLLVVGYIWHTGAGFIVWDWADRQVGVFDSLSAGVHSLSTLEASRWTHPESTAHGRSAAAGEEAARLT